MQGNLREILQKLGRDAALPGVELAIELLQELRADLMGGAMTAREVIDAAVIIEPKRIGRPPGKSKGGVNGWPIGREARSREMKRRQAVARANKTEEAALPYVNHPRDPRHPNHERWLKRLRASQKKAWDAKSPAERQAHSERMRAAKAAKRTAA